MNTTPIWKLSLGTHQNKSDLYEAPEHVYYDVFEYLPLQRQYWNPFESETSKEVLEDELQLDVLCTKLENMNNILEQSFEHVKNRLVIGHPPFSKKFEIISLFLQYKISFILLLPISVLGCVSLHRMLLDKKAKVQYIHPKSRVHYMGVKRKESNKKARATFDSIWLCCNADLPNDIKFLKT